MISDYNQSTETITDTFMVDVSSVFGKTELKLSQQESNFWYPQTWWIDYLTNLKLFWPKQSIPIQIILETNSIFIINFIISWSYIKCVLVNPQNSSQQTSRKFDNPQ